jgi:maspardin
MVERLDQLDRIELASRLTLNMLTGYIEPQHISAQGIEVMIMSVLDQTAITNSVQNEMLKCYPGAKEAHVKDGGNFPYLSRDQEVNIYLKVQLRQFEKTRYSAGDDFDWEQSTTGASSGDGGVDSDSEGADDGREGAGAVGDGGRAAAEA